MARLKRDVVRMVVAEGTALTVTGVSIALAVAALSTRALEGMLFEMEALDPITFGGAALALAAGAILASDVPGRRAAQVPPVIALGR